MNTELTENITAHFLEWQNLWQQAQLKGMPVVVWRYPKTSSYHVIVSFDTSQSIDLNEQNVEQLPTGFLINPFEAHHPVKPYWMKADMWWRKENELKPELTISPVINAHQIEAFFKAPNKDQTTIHPTSEMAVSHDFLEMVKLAKAEMHTGLMSKVVLARSKKIALKDNFSPIGIFEKACMRYPNAFIYLLFEPTLGTWIGATPETLIHVDENGHFTTQALAGTQPLQSGQTLADVAWTQKEIEEQAMVSRYIIDCFKKIRLREFEEQGPKTIKAGNMAHLSTLFQVDMREVNIPNLGSIMTELLHPTSAVCGMPLNAALDFIHRYEKLDRELYSGFLGPVNIEGKTNLFVNLRCAKIHGREATLFAGAGITPDSIPEKEWMETEIKMKTIGDLLSQS